MRSPSRPASGRVPSGSASHFGPPIAPSRIASAERQPARVSAGSGAPQRSMALPPNGKFAKFELMAEGGGAILEQLDGGARHFWADAISRQHSDVFSHFGHREFGVAVIARSRWFAGATALGGRRTLWMMVIRSRSVISFSASACAIARR